MMSLLPPSFLSITFPFNFIATSFPTLTLPQLYVFIFFPLLLFPSPSRYFPLYFSSSPMLYSFFSIAYLPFLSYCIFDCSLPPLPHPFILFLLLSASCFLPSLVFLFYLIPLFLLISFPPLPPTLSFLIVIHPFVLFHFFIFCSYFLVSSH